MRLFLRLAWLNVFRNRRRTAITLAAMVCGTTGFLFAGGFVQAIYYGLREQFIHGQSGHIQIFRRGFLTKGKAAPLDYTIADFPKVKRLIEALPSVKMVTPRLEFFGLLSKDDLSVSVFGMGVDAEKETAMGERRTGAGPSLSVIKGRNLRNGDKYGVIIGKGLAETLDAKVGDALTLLTPMRGGSVNGSDVFVRGIFQSGAKEFDDRALKIPIDRAQFLVNVPDRVQTIVVLLDDTERTEATTQRLLQLFRAQGLDLELRTWSDIAYVYHQVRKLFDRIFGTMTFIIAVMVVLGITNTLTIAIFERTREIGTMMAMGAQPRTVLKLFVLEGLTLGVAGGALGVLVGVIVCEIAAAIGVPMPPPPLFTRGYTVYPYPTLPLIIEGFCLSVVTAVLASLYPAYRAARLQIAEALRFV